LAWKLAEAGRDVLLLERGGYLPREKANWDTKAVFSEGRYKAKESWLDRDGKPFHPGIHYYVGGQTKVYGAALLRMRERDFGEVRHFGGTSPAWPISYRDLEPWYGQAEALYRVHGERGVDPTEPWASTPYPHPPLAHEPRIAELADDLRRAGVTPFPLPVGIRLDESRREASPCVRCDTCDGFPCLVDGKADAHVTCVRPATSRPGFTLRTDAYVERLETDASGGAVTRAVVRRGGALETYEADVFVVACGAVNSAALLLRSTNDAHPRGLANRSGAVGRHYMCHHNSALLAISKRPNPTVFQKTLAFNDWYFDADDSDLPLGHVQMLGKSNAEMLREDAPRIAPGFALDFLAKHALDFWMTSEDLPDPENRVTLERDGTIRLSYVEGNLEGHRRLYGKLKALIERLGCEKHLFPQGVYLGKKIPIAGVAHQCGTVRFGRDPRTSALDPDCKAHDVDNLYVADASFFPSSSAVNPGLTVMANALRVGERILARLS
ncbi:MAG TPA: GMC family oxidoreductase, partial [Planctomycetota bacterium]|nr:GMC family oxidoreductase [Planctomycetota bacterium]